jgi:hypothetical protein
MLGSRKYSFVTSEIEQDKICIEKKVTTLALETIPLQHI